MNHTTHPPDTQTWLQSSVQQFFKTCNWDDQPIEVQEIRFASLLDDNTSLDLTLSVSQFFASVNWDGTSLMAPALVIEEPELAEADADPDDSFTLTDLSDLF